MEFINKRNLYMLTEHYSVNGYHTTFDNLYSLVRYIKFCVNADLINIKVGKKSLSMNKQYYNSKSFINLCDIIITRLEVK